MSDYYDYRPSRMGDVAGDVAAAIVTAIKPQLAELTAEAAKAADPVITRIIHEEVIPGVAPYIVVGMIGLGAIAATIGVLLARRRAR